MSTAQIQSGRFVCDSEGCRRLFSRQEHLQRHLLNHAGQDFTCERPECRTVFKRPDLLDRHMARHRQKDAEGGKLMTRKRLHKDENGNVISKPPAKARRTTASSHETRNLPLSPPQSSSDPAVSPQAEGKQLFRTTQSAENLDFDFSDQPTNFEPFTNDFLNWNNAAAGSNEQSYGLEPFDDIFQPDTASSFNMPYTTASNYNWLFDMSFDNLLQSTDTLSTGPGAIGVPGSSTTVSVAAESAGMSNTMLQSPEEGPFRGQKSATKPTTAVVDHGYFSPDEGALQATDAVSQTPAMTAAVSNAEKYCEKPMEFLSSNASLPIVEDIAYERLIDLIEQASPVMPNESLISLDNHLLAPASLQSWLDLFFTRFNTAYPLIHMASFSPTEAEPLLLLSMMLLGATYGDKDAHQLAVCIHDVLRPQIFSHSSFSAKPELWTLQTILLTECLGKSRGGQRQHDMSHLFHGLLINLIRRSDCQTACPETSIDSTSNVHQQWKTWIDMEQKKRLAQLCFLWDVQHAVLFSQSLCMSAFELRSTLPCDQALWEALTAEQWLKTWQAQSQKPTHLLSALKAYLKPQKDSAMLKQLNALSRMVILHGLMSISWDMTRRDQTSLGVMASDLSAGSWRDRMSKAYDNWNSDFEVHTEHLLKSGSKSSRDFVVANRSIYHSAQLILHAEILDLQIYAGARHILGRTVSRVDYSRSQKVVKSWANKESAQAARAVRHAAEILRDASTNANDLTVVGDLFHHPWTICLAALTIWSFYHAQPKSAELEDDEMIWNPRDDMAKLLKTISSTPLDELARKPQPRNATAGMTAIVSNNLSSIRWGVIHDGMTVLKELTPWRIINDDR